MGKRVNKILWHGSEINADGTPKPPSPATAADGLDGLNAGEVYIHEEDKAPAIYILTDAGRVVAIGGSDIETLAKTFLRKDQPDSTKYLLKLLGGAEFGEYLQGVSGGKIDANGAAELLSLVLRGLLTVDELRSKAFTSGALGSGFTLKIDENGDSYLEIDRMLVRKVATFIQLLIQELKHVGGQIILSPASMKCARVEDMGDYYRCYFENTDGDRTISQQFVTGDQARCQTFNIKEGVNENVTNTYYWRLVTGTGDDYIDLSKADCDAGSTVPQAGDEIVQLGNRTDATRQGAIVLAAYGDDSPSIKLYKGINSYSLAGKEKIILSPQAVNIIADSLKFSTGENVKEELDTAKENAEQAKNDAEQAKSDAEAAKNRLDQWAADGVISPTEKQGLKDEIARIKGDYDEINAGYSKYGLGTPSTYNSAYNSYLSVLTTLSADTPETIAIPSYFASRQTTYYTQRTNALNAIATAAKDYVDDMQDTITETVMEAVDGKITLAVKTETAGLKDEILQETESKIQVLREEVSLYSGRITTVENDLDTAEGKISSLETRVSAAELKITPDAIIGTVSSTITTTAQQYANTAKQEAISAAASDATTKANNALASAKQDAAGKYATITTVSSMQTSISQLSSQISLKANSSTVTQIQNDLNAAESDISSLESRMSAAELKITPDAIISTVSSNLQVGGRNLYQGTKTMDRSKFTITNTWYETTQDGFTVLYCYNAWARIYQTNKLEVGKTYTLSAYVRGNGTATIEAYVTGGTIIERNFTQTSKLPTSWGNRYWIVFEVTAENAFARFENGTTTGATFYIYALKLEEGNIPTAWTPAPEDNPTATEIASQMVQTANGFTFYGKTFDIKASIMTAENIAALNISTGNLTVKTGAKIGGWTVNGSNLEVTGDNTAKIRVEPSGTKFLRINSSTSTLLEMRADSMTGLRIYTQDTLGTCVNLMAQTGGISMESHGNMELDARQGESIQLNGDVRVQGLSVGTARKGSNYTVPYNVTFVSVPYGCTITLPSNPPIGRVVIVAASTTATVNYSGNGKFIMFRGVYQSTWNDEKDYMWNFFFYDGTYWQRLRIEPTS